MIKYIKIENFKSLKSISLPTEKLNLFFGMNGMGKSSVLQALLLLRQSFWYNDKQNIDRLRVNGSLVELGSGRDILSQSAEENFVRFLVQYRNEKIYDCRYDLSSLYEGFFPKMGNNIYDDFNDSLFSKSFNYLSAEHLGPIDSFSTLDWDKEGLNFFGNMGERTVPFLASEGSRFVIPNNLCHPKEDTPRLINQVSAWMSEISPGIRVITELFQSEHKAKLSFSYEGEQLMSTPYRPVNVGFGIQYVLPLVVALLTSNENSLILIENPESHLHPRGQSLIAELMSLAAANGAQILCESHSDHVVNSVRLAVKRKMINNSDLGIFYFNKDKNQDSFVNAIAVNQNGALSDYPEGFLDEWGKLLADLI